MSALALLLVQIAVILTVSRAVGWVFRRFLGQPLVVAEIVAGLLLGPSALGALSPETMAALFPAEGMAGLGAVSQLGLVLFMFVVGLEFDISRMKNLGNTAVLVSQFSIIAPFLLGTTLALVTYPLFSTAEVPFIAFALFSGASMSVTAFPVLARILSERGLMRTKLGALTLTCAAVDDVTAWCLLAVTIAVVRSGGIAAAVQTTAFAVVFIAAMLGIVRPVLARVAQRYGTEESLGQTAVAFTLLLLLLSAVTAEVIGVHALFGAFLFGVVVPRQGPIVRALTERVEDLVVVLLLPLFFAFTGLRTAIGLVDTPELWAWTGAIILVATVGKFGGTAIPARISGIPWRESATLGVLMNTRGLMELVILNIGRDLGVLSPVLFTILVLMAVVTTFVTSPLVSRLFPREQALSEHDAPVAPSPTMITTVLCSVADPRVAPAFGRLLARLCSAPDTRGVALSLEPIRDLATLFPELPEDTEGEEERAADVVAEHASRHGVEIETHSFPSADPAADIVAVASRQRARLVLLGLHRPLMGTARLGGPLPHVAEHLDGDLGMFLDRGLAHVDKVLVARGGEHDEAAARIGARLAAGGARVVELRAAPGEDALPALLRAAAEGYDLVVAGAGKAWDLPMHAFDLRDHPMFTQVPCSLLVAHGPEGR